MFKPKMPLEVPAPRWSSNHEMFERAGQPWCTAKDWQWEANLSTNPRANTQARLSAAAFTQRHAKEPQRVKRKSTHVPAPRPIPVSEESALKKRQYQNLQALLRLVDAENPKPEVEKVELRRNDVYVVHKPEPQLTADQLEAIEDRARAKRMLERERQQLIALGKMYRPYPFSDAQRARIDALFGSWTKFKKICAE